MTRWRRSTGPDEVIGSADDVVIPGLINCHHHVGLTPVQLGSRDYALELWFATRIAGRRPDPYLDTLYSAFEMIASGVTTVQHLNGWLPLPLSNIERIIGRIIDAYDDIGMRASYSYSLRDQNRLVYEADEDFLRRLPDDLAAELGDHLARDTQSLDEQLGLFESTREKYHGRERIRIQLAPANLHWCSDQGACRAARPLREVPGAHAHASWSRPLTRKSMPGGGAAARQSTICRSTACWGRE